MKGIIHYVKGHKLSEKMAKDCYDSYKKYNWDVELIEGYTPLNVHESDISKYTILPYGRLIELYKHKSFFTKLSIIANQIRFWNYVVEMDEPMAYIEHDSLCIRSYYHVPFEDVLMINMDETSIKHQMKNVFCREEYFNYKLPKSKSIINDLPNDWPWTYDFDTIYKDSKLPPGVSAYIITPEGAKKLLDAIDKYGIEQGDMTINTHNVDIKYCVPKMSSYHQCSILTKSLNEDYND